MYPLETYGDCLGQGQGGADMVMPDETIEPGSRVIVVPKADSLLATLLTDGICALGKIFLGRTEQSVRLATLSPPAVIDFPLDEVEALQHMVGDLELERMTAEEIEALEYVAQFSTEQSIEPINPNWRPSSAAHLSAFTGEQMSRYANRDLVGATAGPTFELINQLNELTGAVSNASVTRADLKKLRQMLPFQNLFYLRRLFNAVEEGVNDLAGIPKTRRR